jgi:hypothetical protein
MKEFIRKMYISAVISSCILFGFFAVCVAYQNIRQVGFGEYRNAIEFKDGTIYFFDYQKNINNK